MILCKECKIRGRRKFGRQNVNRNFLQMGREKAFGQIEIMERKFEENKRGRLKENVDVA